MNSQIGLSPAWLTTEKRRLDNSLLCLWNSNYKVLPLLRQWRDQQIPFLEENDKIEEIKMWPSSQQQSIDHHNDAYLWLAYRSPSKWKKQLAKMTSGKMNSIWIQKISYHDHNDIRTAKEVTVTHPLIAILSPETSADLISSIVLCNFFAHQKHLIIAFHLFVDRTVQCISNGNLVVG